MIMLIVACLHGFTVCFLREPQGMDHQRVEVGCRKRCQLKKVTEIFFRFNLSSTAHMEGYVIVAEWTTDVAE